MGVLGVLAVPLCACWALLACACASASAFVTRPVFPRCLPVQISKASPCKHPHGQHGQHGQHPQLQLGLRRKKIDFPERQDAHPDLPNTHMLRYLQTKGRILYLTRRDHGFAMAKVLKKHGFDTYVVDLDMLASSDRFIRWLDSKFKHIELRRGPWIFLDGRFIGSLPEVRNDLWKTKTLWDRYPKEFPYEDDNDADYNNDVYAEGGDPTFMNAQKPQKKAKKAEVMSISEHELRQDPFKDLRVIDENLPLWPFL